MSFNGAASISQGVDPTSFSVTDTSTGSDTNLTTRQIFLYLSDGSTLTPPGSATPYIPWPIVSGIGDVINLTGILQRDYSINAVVLWVSSSPLSPPSTYTYSVLKTFIGNIQLFAYGLTQLQAGNPLLVNDNGYFPNKSKLRVLIEDAIDCETYNDQYNSQLSLNAAYKLQVNQKSYF